MTERTTTIRYDVASALGSLRTLANAVRDGASAVVKRFGEGGAAVKRFEGVLRKISPAAASALSTVKSFAGLGLSPMGVATTGATLAVGALIARLINLPEVFRDANEQLRQYNQELENANRLQKGIVSFRASGALRGLEVRQRGLSARRADISEEQAANDEQRSLLTDRLSQYKEFYGQLDTLAKDSARKRQTLEDQLQNILSKRADRADSQLGVGQQFQRALERATQAREGGDFQEAERLLDKAAALADAQGGHAFFTRQIAAEEDKLVAALQKGIDARTQDEAAAARSQSLVGARIASLEAETKALKDRNDQLRRESKTIRGETRRIGLERAAIGDQVTGEQADLDFQKSFRQLTATIATGDGTVKAFFNQLKLGKDSVFRGRGGVQDDQVSLTVATAMAVKAAQALAKGDIESASKAAIDINRRVESVDRVKGTSAGFDTQIERLRLVVEKIGDAVESATRQVSAGRSPGFSAPGSNVPVPQNVAQATAPLAAPPHPTQQNITVTANVKGGIIDAETTRAISQIIRTELRKQNIQPSDN